MNLAVIAPAYYPTEAPYRLLTTSCARHDLPLYPFGKGQQWPGDTTAHFVGALQAVRNLPSICELIMFTDAGDAFVLGGADEIEAKFQVYGCDFLMAAEQDLYPWGLEEQWAARKSHRDYQPLWQYPNGGGWVGRREKVEQILVYAASASGDEAQSKWISTYCSGEFNFQLDYRCLIFQTMSGDIQPFQWDHGRLWNTRTGSHPVVIHFNGKLGGIEAAHKEAYEV